MWKSLLALYVFGLTVGSARTWTDATGRMTEAEFVRATNSKVILRYKGREITFPLSRLSDADRNWIDENRESAAGGNSVGGTMLAGTTLHPGGGIEVVTADLTETTLKPFSKAAEKPTKLRVAVQLPADFDPAKPMRVLWVSSPINNEGERKAGNESSMHWFAATAVSKGWVVVAADTDIGNPIRPEEERAEGSDVAVQHQAVELLSAAWPGFKDSAVACCGHSGGAKVSFKRIGHLLAAGLNVKGGFFSGCNQDNTAEAFEEVRFSKSKLKKVRAFISNGRMDDISTVAHAEGVRDSVASNYDDVRLELFDGDHHVVSQEHLVQALAWFCED